MALYSAIIDRMDQNIGRVIEKLRTAGRLDNTLFLFMVDNGVPGTGVHDWRGLFAKNGRHLKHALTTTPNGVDVAAGPPVPVEVGPTLVTLLFACISATPMKEGSLPHSSSIGPMG